MTNISVKFLPFCLIFFFTCLDANAARKIKEMDHFGSIRASKANIRSGPGKHYPIKFIFNTRGVPVHVISEYDNWNEIKDYQGHTGWVSKVLLTKSEKMNFLGVEFYFKASQDSKSFEEVQSIYNNIVEQYKRNNSTKDNTIENLKNEFLDLKSKIDECEDVSSIVDVIENEFLDLENINETIQHDSEMISEAIQF